jgi:hypothetical protein
VNPLQDSRFWDVVSLYFSHELLHFFVKADLGGVRVVRLGKLVAVYQLAVIGLAFMLRPLFSL